MDESYKKPDSKTYIPEDLSACNSFRYIFYLLLPCHKTSQQHSYMASLPAHYVSSLNYSLPSIQNGACCAPYGASML